MKNIIIILLLLSSTQVVGQYKKDKGTNVPGIIGIAALPVSFIISEINYSNFVGRFGDREGYMQGSKLNSYENMMNQNESIIITGAIVAITGLVIQHFITNRKSNSKTSCW